MENKVQIQFMNQFQKNNVYYFEPYTNPNHKMRFLVKDFIVRDNVTDINQLDNRTEHSFETYDYALAYTRETGNTDLLIKGKSLYYTAQRGVYQSECPGVEMSINREEGLYYIYHINFNRVKVYSMGNAQPPLPPLVLSPPCDEPLPGIKKSQCSICFDDICYNQYIQACIECNNIFHYLCTDNYKVTKCPLCNEKEPWKQFPTPTITGKDAIEQNMVFRYGSGKKYKKILAKQKNSKSKKISAKWKISKSKKISAKQKKSKSKKSKKNK